MKKLSVLVLLTIGLGLTLFHACQKEMSNLKESSIPDENSLKTGEMSQEDQLCFYRLMKFKMELDTIENNSNYTSSWNMSVDSTLWYLRAFINATYCRSNLNYLTVVFDTLYINIGKDYGSLINLNDIKIAYENIIAVIAENYSQLVYVDKELYGVNMNQIIVDHGASIVPVLVVYGICPGSGGNPPIAWKPFGENEDWWYGETYGHCNNSSIGTDAAEEIQEVLNTYVPGSYYVPPAPIGSHYVYILDATTVNLEGYEYDNPDDQPPLDNEEDFLIYYCDKNNNFQGSPITPAQKCLDGPELNFYYFSERKVICELLPADLNKPDDWVFRWCDLVGRPVNDYHMTQHYNYLQYAKRVLVLDILPCNVNLIWEN